MQIVYFFVYAFEAIIATIYFTNNHKRKHHILTNTLIAISLYSICFALNVIFKNNFIVNQLSFLIINVIYSKIAYDMTIKSSIFHSSILLAIMFLTELIVEISASVILHIPIDAYKQNLHSLIILGVICKILYLIICEFISILHSYKNNHIKDVKKIFSLFLFPIMISIIITIFLYASTIYRFSSKLNLAFVLASILSLIFCCAIFIINQKVQKQEQELMKLQTEFQKDELDRTFYNLLEKANNDQRVLMHDVKHHLSAIGALDSIADIREYLTRIEIDLAGCQFIGKSNNKMLDLIMNKYFTICQMNGIKYYVDVRSSNLSFIGNKDLISILGNLFDNAVTAAIGSEDPFIEFTLRKENSFLILSLINSSAAPPKIQGDRLITTKPNALFHGNGVKSIEQTAALYDGICHWEYHDSDSTFHFNIIFNNTKVSKI